MLLKEIRAYHGGDLSVANKKLKPPVFLALNKDDARWYAIDRHNGKPAIMAFEVTVKNILDTSRDSDEGLMDIATSAGIEFETNPYFYCADIAEHSPYDGGNVSDLVYIPAFQRELKKKGYDAIKLLDPLSNAEIETLIVFSSSALKFIEADELEIP